MMLSMIYRVADAIPDAIAEKLAPFDSLSQQLLHNRGFTSAEEAQPFLHPSYDTGLHDPFLMRDMEVAVERILSAVQAGERIAIYSDYDCDGIPGAVVLHDFFTKIGHDNLTNYIPHRHYEGFGFNTSAVEKLAADNVTLIITVDCGTTDHTALAAAKTAGLEVIVTDHHEIPETEPDCFALLNPKVADGYPFTELCGAGVAYKLVQATIEKGEFDLPPGWEKWLLDMVGVATIADMVPLTGENRVLAHYGLMVLRKSRRPGIQHLFRVTKGSQKYATEDDVGFTIGPRVNAASRMDTPEAAFQLLTTTDEGEAGAQAKALEQLNNERKGVVAGMSKELKKKVQAQETLPSVLVFGNPDWRPSLVGLAANSLAEQHNRPTFVWGRDGNGVIKGSCRSDGQTSVLALMRAVAAELLEHGGHQFSGGFSVSDQAIHTLGEKLNTAYVALGSEAAIDKTLVADSSLTLEDITPQLLQALRQLAPFGVGNEKPLFLFPDIAPREVGVFGKTKEHTKLVFDTVTGPREAIQFFKVPEQYDIEPKVEVPLSLLAHIEESFFMGRKQTRLRIVDIV